MKIVSKFLMFFIIVGVVVVVGLVVLNRSKIKSIVDSGETTEVMELAFGGSVIYVEGEVQYDYNGLEEVTSVKDGLNVFEGYTVATGNDGRVIIQLDDGSVVRLNNNSGIVLTSLDPNNIIITHTIGEVYSRVVAAERAFDVVVDNVTIKSLGTAFKTTNLFSEKGVEVYQSQVNVTEDGGEDVLVDEGQMYFVKTDNPELEGVLTPIDTEELSGDLFVLWNKAEDEKDFGDKLGVLKDVKGSESSVNAITVTSLGVGKVEWEVDGELEYGVKVVWSKNAGPEYPSRSGDKYIYITDPETTSASVEAFDGDGRYYIRVCEFLGDNCEVYSNEVQVDFYGTEQITETAPPPTNLSIWSNGGGNVGWSTDRNFEKGFKLVWSKNAGPTYPNRSGDYNQLFSNSSARSGTITAQDGGGTYYVRVCEYLSGSCGIYSNEITVTLEGDDKEDDAASGVSSISLSGSGASVSWSTNGTSAQGFKIVWSKNSGPTYPLRSGDKYTYLSSPSASSTTLTAFDGDGTYYVRVCEYLGGSCGVYSNEISVTLYDDKDDEPVDDQPADDDVSSISLWSNGGNSVGWSTVGTSDKGFKVVWSLNASPTYPTRGGDSYQYLSSPSASGTTLKAFSGTGTYYVRVCEYLGGACGVYSNQITVELTK
ncbi:MAG: FecR domain-containing protein [Patescibacteria group bacterium]